MAEIYEYIHIITENHKIDTLPANICDSKITEAEAALHLKNLKNNKAAVMMVLQVKMCTLKQT